MNRNKTMSRLVGAFVLATIATTATAQSSKPNIIYVFVDDLGSGEVGFTNPDAQIDTPNLDALASGGLHFTQAYATAICSPSRGVLYTGYHSGHAVNDQNVENFRDEDIMPGEVMKAAGYGTAVYGKWGFGSTSGTHTGTGGLDSLRINPTVTNVATLPTSHGYDEFVGYLNHVQAHRFFNDPLWQADDSSSTGVSHYVTGNNAGDNVTNTFDAYTDDIHTDEAIGFIQSQAASDTPFLLQMHYNSPHPPHDPGGVLTTAYGDYDGNGDTTMYDDYIARGLSVDQAERAAMISRLDEHVGALTETLRDPNGDGNQDDSIINDTIIMFTSDNGGEFKEDQEALGGNNIYGKDLRGTKRDLYEGGVRVPMIAYWEGTISPGNSHALNLDSNGDGNVDAASTDHIIDLADFMATAAELGGRDAPIGIDGVSYAGLLTGEGVLRKRDYHIWEHHERDGDDPDTRDARWSVLKDNIKLITYSDGSQDMFDLVSNPEELAAQDLLDTGLQQWIDLKDELTAIADAEGAVNGNRIVKHVNWVGADGGDLADSQNWSNYNTEFDMWVSVINNMDTTAAVATANVDTELLGLEVRGEVAQQTVRVDRRLTLAGRNEVRISSGGRIHLDHASLESVRWVDVKQEGVLTGHGDVSGAVYNWGTIAPGLPTDLNAPSSSPSPTVPQGIDTGVVTAVAFNFTGVQDDAPLTQTLRLSEYLTVSQGLDFGPGVTPRNSANAGDEFNVARWNTLSKAEAIAADDYVGFEVTPVFGIEMLVDKINFTLWRNGTGAPKSYGTFTSIDGFAAGSEIGLWEDFFSASDTSTQTLTAQYAGDAWTSQPLEVRLYAWDTSSTTSLGNTHITAVSMTGSFRTLSPDQAVVFDFTGTQNNAPLNATSVLSPSVTVSQAMDFGAGTQAAGSGAAGNEFNVEGWATESLAQAITEEDYLHYELSPVAGVEMQVREVSFTLWREDATSATHHAVMTSIDGFTAGSELDSWAFDLNNGGDASDAIGMANESTLTASYLGGEWTTNPVEVRLYGWRPAMVGAGGSTHVNAAAMTAYFRTIDDPDVVLDPTGVLTFNGDFFHVEGGLIAMQLGGTSLTDPLNPEYDRLVVSGMAEIAGDLIVELTDGFTPELGDSFDLFDWAAVAGDFANVLLPELIAGLAWDTSNLLTTGAIGVVPELAGDFNFDGVVDAADYTIWRDTLGQTGLSPYSSADANGDGTISGHDYLIWRDNFGVTTSSESASIPEPAAVVLLIIAASMARHRRTRPFGIGSIPGSAFQLQAAL